MKNLSILLLSLLSLFLLSTSLFPQSSLDIQPAVNIQSVIDIDADNDGLIEIHNLEDLNAMRYQLDGSGYRGGATAKKITSGCAVGGCKGYELTGDLDFNDVASYKNSSNLKLWTTGAGWQPIGDATNPFNAIFKTNNVATPYTIFNLRISRTSDTRVGLFGHTGSDAEISGIGLLNVQIEGGEQVGGLVGESLGLIRNSYASGTITATGGTVGLLAGVSRGVIMNSYADGVVVSAAHSAGGLVGANRGSISNSYARGNVVAQSSKVGGLVGDNAQGTISNCYTVSVVSGSEDIGGLVGISNLGTFINNYVSSKVSGNRYVGGLVGSNIGGVITQSYWDKTHSKLKSSTGGVGLDSSELQAAAGQDQDPNKPYYKWSVADWDFGTDKQYPVLKYAAGKDTNNPACGTEQSQPKCGSLLLGQHASLKSIILPDDIEFTPVFKPNQLNYYLNITTTSKSVRFIPTASNPQSTINISRNATVIDSNLANGTTSSAITLTPNTEITIEASNEHQRPAHYRFTVNYLPEIVIADISMYETVDEGDFIILNTQGSTDPEGDVLSYRWKQTAGKDLLLDEEAEYPILLLNILYDYVGVGDETAEIGLTIEATDSKATITKDITLTVNKIDNATIPIGTPTLDILVWTAPEINLSLDPDGTGSNLQYQWQSRNSDADTQWTDIEQANEKTHAMSFLTEIGTEYRVLISYIDGQGYQTTKASGVATYTPQLAGFKPQRQETTIETTPAPAIPTKGAACNPANDNDGDGILAATDIDDDGDGLIEICYLEELDAMRNQLDGSGYQESSTSNKITTGCAIGGCKGYELMQDLDFDEVESYRSREVNTVWTMTTTATTALGWEPIGGHTTNWFTGIFEGNGYTISNLRIKKPTDGVGLFGQIHNCKINRIGLQDVHIVGNFSVGGLAGSNHGGIITNSYVMGTVSGKGYVGGLAGFNIGDITNSYAAGTVLGPWVAGGLVGYNWIGNITNSYAASTVSGDSYVGGLVGQNKYSIIKNSYAVSTVSGDSYVGGLVGLNDYIGRAINNYAASTVSGDSYVGGLVGHINIIGYTTLNSYWDTKASGMLMSDVDGKTTKELQSPTTATGIYQTWSTKDWDFGAAEQYPRLRYQHIEGVTNPDCDSAADVPCPVLPGQTVLLDDLVISPGNLVSNFDPETFKYITEVDPNIDKITLHTTATDATIRISSDRPLTDYAISTGTATATVPLRITTTNKITLTVSKGHIKSLYTIEVGYKFDPNAKDIEGNPIVSPEIIRIKVSDADRKIGEGTRIDLEPKFEEENNSILRYEWRQTLPPSPNVLPTTSKLTYSVPKDFVPAAQTTQTLEFTFTAMNKAGIGSKTVSLTINKVNNGQAEINVAQAGSILTASLSKSNPDPDGNPENMLYQWQSRKHNSEWRGINGANSPIYSIPLGSNGTQYRMKLSYTDGQGHRNEEAISNPITYTNIDENGNDLIDIRYLEDLNAIRHNLAGTSYKANSTSTGIKTGCANKTCKGYELMGDLDFNDTASYRNAAKNKTNWTVDDYEDREDKGWEPIGNIAKSFNAMFKGNNYTISNLMINRNSNYIGLFAHVSQEAEIDGVNLHQVDIRGQYRVGALAGWNKGNITNLSVDGKVTGSSGEIGGVIGFHESRTKDTGRIERSYAAVQVMKDSANAMVNDVGGLVGRSIGNITNSYTNGSVSGKYYVGGLVGQQGKGKIKNSYTLASVTGDLKGNLVGNQLAKNKIPYSYWNKAINPQMASDNNGGEGKTTSELQSPIRATKIYRKWDDTIWDFGTSKQYPALKYSDGELLKGQRQGLQSLQLSEGAVLLEELNTKKDNHYTVLVANELMGNPLTSIQAIATAAHSAAKIKLITSNSSTSTIRQLSFNITLDSANTTMTLVVTREKREVSYTFDIVRFEVGINSNGTTFDEGDRVILSATTATDTYQWSGDNLFTTSTASTLDFTISPTYITGDTNPKNIRVELTATRNVRGKQIESFVTRSLTINKKNNGTITGGRIKLSLKDALITATTLTKAILSTDVDGVNDNPNIRYQLERKPPLNDWGFIISTTTNLYRVPDNTPNNTKYRALISYTDGQGYRSTTTTKAITYIDIDRDNNGLIEITTAEQLNAIRYRVDGTGYQSTAEGVRITTGCRKVGGCNGYELKAHIDLSGYGSNWLPIIDDGKGFNAIFDGNNYTIYNLKIDSSEDNIGLFAKTETGAEIRNVGLLNVDIKGGKYVGGLVSDNQGDINNSYVVGKVGGGEYVGGLVGENSGSNQDGRYIQATISNSHAIVIVGNTNSRQVGGLVGHNKAKINNSYVIAKQIKGRSNVGGLVGINEGGSITNSYATVKELTGCRLIGNSNNDIDASNKMIGDCTDSTLFE